MEQKQTMGCLIFTLALGYIGDEVFEFLETLCVSFLDYNGLTTEQKVTFILIMTCLGIVINYARKLRVSS
jgi:hypothetical protein